jgi:hypothetical protein
MVTYSSRLVDILLFFLLTGFVYFSIISFDPFLVITGLVLGTAYIIYLTLLFGTRWFYKLLKII